jgi:hypothetical protein
VRAATSADDPAIAAYRAVVAAFNRRDRAAYFAGFADTLRCYYGRADVPRSSLERSRLQAGERGVLAAAQLSVLARSDGELALLDRGFFSEDPGSARQTLHEKIVVLHRDGEAWRIVAETTFAERGCLGSSVPSSAEPSAALERCRASHRACMAACSCTEADDACRRCRLGCESGAMSCLGIGAIAASSGDPAPTPIRLTSPAEVRRFVELTLLSNRIDAGTADDEISPADARWIEAVSIALGAPRWRGNGLESGSCGWQLVSAGDGELLDAVRDVRCTASLDRCVAAIGSAGDGYELHLLFDGGRLRVAQLVEATGGSLDAALDRFATARPAGWDAPCAPGIVALAEDRVGEDFFEVTETFDQDEEGEGGYAVRRLCGADARRAVHDLGDRWRCDAVSCAPYEMCGNYCAYLSIDPQGRVLSHGSGIDVPAIGPTGAGRLRAQMPCGGTRSIGFDEMVELSD